MLTRGELEQSIKDGYAKIQAGRDKISNGNKLKEQGKQELGQTDIKAGQTLIRDGNGIIASTKKAQQEGVQTKVQPTRDFKSAAAKEQAKKELNAGINKNHNAPNLNKNLGPKR